MPYHGLPDVLGTFRMLMMAVLIVFSVQAFSLMVEIISIVIKYKYFIRVYCFLDRYSMYYMHVYLYGYQGMNDISV